MIWHITKRELYDNLISLRFALATFLLFGLMLTNAVVYLREHPERMQKYHDDVTKAQNELSTRTHLYDIAVQGPGSLYKKPSVLQFCAEGGDIFLSDRLYGGFLHWADGNLTGFWSTIYHNPNPDSKNIRPDTIKVDWGFVIGYVLSLIAILFTFDSISGDREHGTLRLTLANAIPRHTVLIGKFLGALVSISVPFTLAVLANLLIISSSSNVQLNTDAWSRLAIIFCIAILYLCLFLALGLLVSSLVQRNAASLVILLLTWAVFVVFMPSTLAPITSGFSKPMGYYEYTQRISKLHKQLKSEYEARGQNMDAFPSKKMELAGEFVMNDVAQRISLGQEYVSQQHAQIQLMRSATRISPVAIVQHLFESFAGSGFERHRHFVENVQRYAREYREFVMDMDRSDPDSPHIIGVREGMSQKPVNPESIPIFEDRLSLSHDFNAAAIDLFLLVLFLVVLLSGAYLAFVRIDV